MDFRRRKKVEVAFFQETYLLEKDFSRCRIDSTVIASSSNMKYNRGVVIPKCTCQHTDLGSGRDTECRVAYVKTVVNGRKIAFLSVYAPNVSGAEVYNYLTNTILELSEFALIIGVTLSLGTLIGQNWDHRVKRTTSSISCINEMGYRLLCVRCLADFTPLRREFTCFSSQNQSFSRIHYIFISQQPYKVSDLDLLPMSLSDHRAVTGEITILSILSTKMCSMLAFQLHTSAE